MGLARLSRARLSDIVMTNPNVFMHTDYLSYSSRSEPDPEGFQFIRCRVFACAEV